MFYASLSMLLKKKIYSHNRKSGYLVNVAH